MVCWCFGLYLGDFIPFLASSVGLTDGVAVFWGVFLIFFFFFFVILVSKIPFLCFEMLDRRFLNYLNVV